MKKVHTKTTKNFYIPPTQGEAFKDLLSGKWYWIEPRKGAWRDITGIPRFHWNDKTNKWVKFK